MPTATPNLFLLSIDADRGFRLIIKVTVFRHDNTLVLSGNEFPLEMELKKGLYTIRIEGNGGLSDKVIALNSHQYFHIGRTITTPNAKLLEPPEIYSSAPLDETVYRSSHNYYIRPAIEFSSFSTWPGQHSPTEATLFIFMRFASKERYLELQIHSERKIDSIVELSENFHLLNSNGKSLLRFNHRPGVYIDPRHGWIAFNTALPYGLYFLEYNGKDARQIPIYLFEGKHTQVFLTLDEQPLFQDMRIFLSDKRSFDPYSEVNKYADLLLGRLQNNDFTLDDALSERLFAMGYPFLDLLHAYFYLIREKSRKNEGISAWMHVMLKRIRLLKIAGGNPLPDLDALMMMDEIRKKKGLPAAFDLPLKGIPLLRIGFEAIKTTAIAKPDLIAQKSLNDYASEYLISDSAFTTFKPLPGIKDEFKSAIRGPFWTQQPQSQDLVFPIDDTPWLKKSGEQAVRRLFSEDVYSLFIQGRKDNYFTWLAFQIRDELFKNANVSLSLLVQQIQVSATTITRKIKEINNKVFNTDFSSRKTDAATTLYNDEHARKQLLKDHHNEKKIVLKTP